jgi:Ribosomal protein L7/L12 C-terminal domain
MLGLFGPSSEFSRHDRARLRRVEQKLDLILNHLGIAFVETSTLPAEVLAAVEAGNKIAAIKALREATGIGLVEAKQEVESYMAGR